MLYNNKNRDYSFYEVLDCVIPEANNEITQECYELLDLWVEKITDKEQKAKLNVKMLDFI